MDLLRFWQSIADCIDLYVSVFDPDFYGFRFFLDDEKLRKLQEFFDKIYAVGRDVENRNCCH